MSNPKLKRDIHIAESKMKQRRKTKPGSRFTKSTRSPPISEEPTNAFAQCLTPEKERELKATVKFLAEPGKGVLDLGSEADLKERLATVGTECDEHTRMHYLDLYLNAGRDLSFYISGLLMNEALLHTKNKEHKVKKFVYFLNQVPIKLGIKMAKSYVPLSGTPAGGELTTEGLDDLDTACARVRNLGATFTSFETVYTMSEFTPTILALQHNATTLARYAASSQRAGLVPIISSIIRIGINDQGMSLEHAQSCTEEVISCLVKALSDHHVYLEGTILQLSIVDPSVLSRQKDSELDEAASVTLNALNHCLPPAIGAVMLANGTPLASVTQCLNEMNRCPGWRPYPISFCFGDVIHNHVVEKWAGQAKNVASAQNLLVTRAKKCSVSSMGQDNSKNPNIFIANHSHY